MPGFVVHFVYLRAQNQSPMPARCPECGSFVKKDAESCPRCGAGLSAIPFTEPKETQTAGQAAAQSRHAKKDKQNKAAAPTKKKTEDKTTKASRNAQQKKSVKSVKKARAAQTDKTSKTSRMAVQKEAAKQPKEETESPHQDTEDYPRLVQEFTAYYNKYQQLRQKALQQPQKFDRKLKRILKAKHAIPDPPDTPWLGRFRIYRDYRCVFRISFKKECILIEWPSQKKNRPDHSDEREPGTDVQTLLQLLCSDLHASSYRESQLSYTSDARIDNLLFDTDSEIFLSALILAITAALTLAIAWYHGKIGLGAAYFLSMGIYIVLPTIVRLFLAKPTHPGKTGNT